MWRPRKKPVKDRVVQYNVADMRPIRGLERPAAQWALAGGCVVITVLAAAEAVMLRRARAENAELQAASLEARLQQQQLEITLGHERTTREALSARPSPPPAAPLATLTLEPLKAR